MDANAITMMLETGGACVADIAHHYGVDHAAVRDMMRRHDIAEPTLQHPQYRHVRKLFAVERLDVPAVENLLYDDEQHRVINGIDVERAAGNLQALDILRHYHGDPVCWFTGVSTNTVMAVDGNPQNFLISNLMPVTQDVITQRFQDSPLLITRYRYTYHDATIQLHLQQRYDRRFGGSAKPMFLDAVGQQWIAPYCRDVTATLSPHASTPENLALSLWRHLSGVALIKGLARLDVEIGPLTASLTRDQYLGVVLGILKKRLGSRLILTPQPGGQRAPIIAPGRRAPGTT